MQPRANRSFLVTVCGLLAVMSAGSQTEAPRRSHAGGRTETAAELPDGATRSPEPASAGSSAQRVLSAAASKGRRLADTTGATAAPDPVALVVSPRSGPPSGGTAFALYGENFQAGAAVEIGGVPATGVVVVSPNQITATTPPLSPGFVHDIAVTNPDAGEGTLTEAFFANFLDVPPPHIFRRFVEKLRRRNVTAGCGGGNYCINAPVTRAQMAVFLLKAKHGASFLPPEATGTVFLDVPAEAFAAAWIEQLAAEGITSGCGGGNFCPGQTVTRAQMAVFLLKARFGPSPPPPATGLFADVPVSSPFAPWIEELFRRGITAGCGGGNYCPGSPNTRGQMAVFLIKTFAGTSQELIAEALEDGLIDYPTSLLYRAYALFWDARLPAAYDGAGSDGEDSAFFQEVAVVWPELSPAEQASLTPFLVRPDDPSSVFGPSGGSRRRPADVGTECPTFWLGTSRPASHFKVHSCSTGDAAADTKLRDDVNALGDSLWTPMTAAPPEGMGPPVGDAGAGGDSKIDVYLLATNLCRMRDEECVPIGGGAVAKAVPVDVGVRPAYSGYMLLDRNRVGTSSLKSDFAHEFFHVLQFAHNWEGNFLYLGKGKDGKHRFDRSWFVEASATWAEWKFVPETAAAQVYWRFTNLFQKSDKSLLDTTELHDYASFIWSYFLQQEKGAADPIFKAWVAIESAANPTQVTDKVDEQLSFKEHFRDFAVRNLNMDLPGKPLDPLYKVQDNDQFPPDFRDLRKHGPITLASAPPTPVKIKALAAQYDRFDEINPEVRKLTFDFAGIKGGAGLDVDAIVSIVGGGYKRIRVQQFPLVFCRDIPEQNVNQVFLVLSNHDKKRSALLSGSYKIKREASCCGNFPLVPAWTGTLSYSYEKSAADSFTEIVLSHSAQVSFRLLPAFAPPPVPTGGWVGLPSGNAAIHDRITSLPDGETSRIDGDGPVVTNAFGFPASQVFLYLDPFACQYSFEFTPVVNASGGGPIAIGHLRSGWRPLGDTTTTVSGGPAFPGHSGFWIATNDGDGYYPGDVGNAMFSLGLVTEDGGGAANVSWSFTPEPVPPGRPQSSDSSRTNRAGPRDGKTPRSPNRQ